MTGAIQGPADPLLRLIKTLVEPDPSRAECPGDKDHGGAVLEREPHAPMMPAAYSIQTLSPVIEGQMRSVARFSEVLMKCRDVRSASDQNDLSGMKAPAARRPVLRRSIAAAVA
ncbi:hypothetical protein F4558_002905 [Micromonospora profundi]|uniref:hypothetical protein n=1 Tax=Micromonospora profundi TaxID=1420889 RepID=UPI00143C9130|nr:hypothetical protein [Micromonospora profundi]NJC13079.1 hypothetical protein [Micromonospora profundi]